MPVAVVTLRGITWDHPRGLQPLLVAAARYAEENPDMRIEWEARSLQAFGDQSLAELAKSYDLLVIDHPHVGEAAELGYLLPLDEALAGSDLERLRSESVGASHDSYWYAGHQWALAIDAAAQVSAYRPDRLDAPPRTWSVVLDLAATGGVLWPLKPVDAMCSFLTLIASAAPCPASADRLVEQDTGVRALELMRSAGELLPERCLEMNPIEVLDELSGNGDAMYSPLLFGYSNYARAGFRPNLLRFADMPSRDGGLPQGSILGGAGISVSSRSSHPELAASHAAWLAGAQVQTSTYVVNGGQPGNRLAWLDERVNDACENFFADTLRTLDMAWVRPRYPGFVALQTHGGDVVHDFLLHGGTPAGVVDRLNQLYRETQS